MIPLFVLFWRCAKRDIIVEMNDIFASFWRRGKRRRRGNQFDKNKIGQNLMKKCRLGDREEKGTGAGKKHKIAVLPFKLRFEAQKPVGEGSSRGGRFSGGTGGAAATCGRRLK